MGLLTKKLQLDIDLPLDPIDFHIMMAVATSPLDSYNILQFVSAQSTLEIGLNTIYINLKKLIKLKWVERAASSVADGNPNRESYQLTGFGKRVLREEITRLEALVRHAYVVGVMEK